MNQQDRTLVIVDYQNVRHQAGKLGVSLTRLAQALWEKARTLPGILDIRLFVPILQATTHWNEVNALALRHGFSVEACPFLREGSTRKDTVDSVIFRWLTQYASPAANIVFVTGDGDFVVAATLLKTQGKMVEVWSFSAEQTSEVLFTTLGTRILLPSQETPLRNHTNPYALAVEKLLGGQKLSSSEVERLERLVEAVPARESDQDLLNALEGLGSRQSPSALRALKMALELRKGGE